MEQEQLIRDLDQFGYDYDLYGYWDAFENEEAAREHWRKALETDRAAMIAALQEIIEEGDEDFTDRALDLIERIKAA